VLVAAAALADAKGIQALTMRRLATDLGVEAMSLYYHLPGKEALLDGLVDHVVGEIDAAVSRLDSRETDSDWRPRLRQRFLAAREVMLRHPWAPGLIGTRSNIPTGLYTYYDGIVGSLIDAGFSYRIAHRALHAFGSLPLGFAQEVFSPTSAGGSLEAETAEAEFATIAEALPHLTAMMSAEAHDVADPTLGWCDSQIEFEFTLDLLLDGLERLRRAG
jgi:AcrR family transcriptional regulator